MGSEMSQSISRRDFLKLLGYGDIALSSSLFLQPARFGEMGQRPTLLVSAQSSGSWAMGQTITAVAFIRRYYQTERYSILLAHPAQTRYDGTSYLGADEEDVCGILLAP